MPEKSILEELQATFPKKGKSDWIHIASTEVNDADPLGKLKWKATGHLSFLPYYDQSDVETLNYQKNFQLQADGHSFLGQRAWYNLAPVTVNDEKIANETSHNHVMHGADGILFDVHTKRPNLSSLLKGIEWQYCNVSFVSSGETSILYDIAQHCREKGYKEEDVAGAVFWKKNSIDRSIALAFVKFKKFYCGGIYIDASAPAAEITEALIRGVRSMEGLIAQDTRPDVALRSVAFSVCVTNDLLVNIAKIKSLRMLWYQVVRAFGVDTISPNDLHIHARVEPWTDEKFQPHGNMLKSTTSSIAAICGGCNSLSVYCEDDTNTMMQRMARNTSVILREESHLARVSDPLAGSYAISKMIDEFAKESWQQFQSALRQNS